MCGGVTGVSSSPSALIASHKLKLADLDFCLLCVFVASQLCACASGFSMCVCIKGDNCAHRFRVRVRF